MIDMAHDGDDGGARGYRIAIDFTRGGEALFHFGFGNALDLVAHFFGDELGGVGVDDVVDLEHLALAHQHLDDVHGAFGHAVGQFLNGDGVRDHHLAGDFFLRHLEALGLLLLALGAAAESGKRPVLFTIIIERVGNGQAAPAAVNFSFDLLGRCGHGNGRALGLVGKGAAAARTAFFIRLHGAKRWRHGARLEPAGGFFRFALGFVVIAAARIFIRLADGGGFALDFRKHIFFGAALGVFDGFVAFIGFTQAGTGKRAAAGVFFFIRQRAQYHAGAIAAGRSA